MLNRYAKYARQKIEWCEPKASWPVTIDDREEHFDPESAVSKTQNYHKEELGQDKEDPRDYTGVQESLEAFFLNHVGDLMMDWKIKLGDAQFETKSDGTVSYDAKIGSCSAVSVAAAAKYNVRSNAFRAEGRVQVSVASILEGFIPDPRKKIAFKALHQTSPPKLKAVLDTSVHASVAVSTQGETLLSGVGYKIPLIDFYEPISEKIPSTGKAEFTVAEIVSGIFSHMVPRMAP
jgi:hypothetical protein